VQLGRLSRHFLIGPGRRSGCTVLAFRRTEVEGHQVALFKSSKAQIDIKAGEVRLDAGTTRMTKSACSVQLVKAGGPLALLPESHFTQRLFGAMLRDAPETFKTKETP
jgi:hypothetical protein